MVFVLRKRVSYISVLSYSKTVKLISVNANEQCIDLCYRLVDSEGTRKIWNTSVVLFLGIESPSVTHIGGQHGVEPTMERLLALECYVFGQTTLP